MTARPATWSAPEALDAVADFADGTRVVVLAMGGGACFYLLDPGGTRSPLYGVYRDAPTALSFARCGAFAAHDLGPVPMGEA